MFIGQRVLVFIGQRVLVFVLKGTGDHKAPVVIKAREETDIDLQLATISSGNHGSTTPTIIH